MNDFEQDDKDRDIILPQPGSEGHVFAKHKANLPPGAENYAINTSARMAEHLNATGGKWQARFPPEPNGICTLVMPRPCILTLESLPNFRETPT